MDIQVVMEELEALGKERMKKMHISNEHMSRIWCGYRCYEPYRQKNKNKSTFG